MNWFTSALAEMVRGVVPGVMLCLLVALGARMMPVAEAETFLPEHDIIIRGKVVAPSCQAQLDTDSLRFDAAQKTGGTGREKDERQVLTLRLGECEFNGIGLK
ncbi:hypothetical protein, partial [Enterobacter ludwigii]|uniref:hypothetical protein n=1 Tax=Enterobacter ludwigii TaxID=299767 RepID=UPI003F6FCCF9